MGGFFRKQNNSSYSDALLKEVKGLELLSSTLINNGIFEIKVPVLQAVSERAIEMEKIRVSVASDQQMNALGIGLAKLHRLNFDQYGLDENNYIGLNPQVNGWYQDWGYFFKEQRLSYQISLITDAVIRKEFQRRLDRIQAPLIKYLNDHCEHASLVHGDLWTGNALYDESGHCWLIDPAVYYGDREVDLAMTEMFGGFSPSFYRGYDCIYPRSAEYANKRVIFNFYHYLNHYNLFGDDYLNGCEEALKHMELMF